MIKNSNIGKKIIGVLLALLMLLAVLAVAFKIYAGKYYRTDTEITDQIHREVEESVNSYKDKDGMVFIPQDQDAKAVIVFFPGGKVEYTAYSTLMYELAERGFICILPRMPENLAFLRINAVDMLTSKYAGEVELVENLDWYLAGHSLGGVAAATYLESNKEKYAGIILCASYTTVDFSGSDLRLLSIYGSEDKVLNMDNYSESKTNWPKNSEEYVIKGGIHSYFGSYGLQDGDGTPTITNEQQLVEAADVISTFCSE